MPSTGSWLWRRLGGWVASKAQLYRYVSEQSERLGITVRQREEEISKTSRFCAQLPMVWW